MRALERWRRQLVLAVVLALGAIWLLGPKYAQLQLASDGVAFRRIVDGARARYVGAGVADVAFAASYALLALAIARRPLASRVGAWFVVTGGVFDEVENLTLIASVAAGSSLSDGRVQLMRAAGAAKYVAIAVGVVLYVGAGVVELLGQAPDPLRNEAKDCPTRA